MSHSHTHAPGEVHDHSHGPPEPHQQQVTLQAPDPALQAIIEADFRPVDLLTDIDKAAKAISAAQRELSRQKPAESHAIE
ncbi:hypothetical protein PILCRDRAFT_249161 [Piloderma croceum F 1598]|uniref:Uncharacterized protein n=1 Tax=Piloderma croceum (strain F 1598) TaxID=765440 RepID=A0A0C3GBY4_PILCF|nr:hypothetical protein PILCRDRAFT_249161 [Piloderma croceum F 1598]